jgi:predicted helicase
VRDFGSVNGISKADGWTKIAPDENNDWLDQVDRSFDKFPILGSKDNSEGTTIFSLYSRGVVTARDAWCYNSSRVALSKNTARMMNAYNGEIDRYVQSGKPAKIDSFINLDPKRISWNRGLKWMLEKEQALQHSEDCIRPAIYRPFEKSWLYFDRKFNDMVYQQERIFPNSDSSNRVIWTTSPGATKEFSAYMASVTNDAQTSDKPQCFPLYLYEDTQPEEGLFATEGAQAGLTRRDAITDAGLAHFQAAYQGAAISKEDLFYYIYGLLHSPEYRSRFANNLAKQLPRIPAVKRYEDFAAFTEAGRKLGHLHVNFETVDPYMVTFKEGNHALITEAQTNPKKFYRVTKMKFGGKGKEKDRSTVIYNDNITMQDIPLEAYDYVVNGKPALEWVMERQVVKTDKDSGIVNDANDYANETVGNPKYPLELFQRVITVSLETMKIVNALPKLEID